MSDAVAKQIAKPQLRGLLNSQIKTNLIVGIGLSIVAGVAYKIFVCDARKNKYAEFYRNYDPEADFQRMKKLGLFQSG